MKEIEMNERDRNEGIPTDGLKYFGSKQYIARKIKLL
jgi:hypothetical protein